MRPFVTVGRKSKVGVVYFFAGCGLQNLVGGVKEKTLHAKRVSTDAAVFLG